jgi:hypothetical protein
MKLLFAVSSLDLKQPFSATPSWWQLLKALNEAGADLIVTPYQGPAIETLWWRAEPNPAKFHGDVFGGARNLMRSLAGGQKDADSNGSAREGFFNRITRLAAQKVISPLWDRHLDRILGQHPDIDAIVVMNIPLNHIVGIPASIQKRHGKPVFYYDGDLPASLPDMHGFSSGFRIYQGAEPAEYTAFFSNSAGACDTLRKLGARRAHTFFYGVDPELFSPANIGEKDIDVMFYGHGREYRAEWIERMIAGPSQSLAKHRFAVRGSRLGHLGRAEILPYLTFSQLRQYVSRSRINLCITRRAHASVRQSSSARPFELASMSACMVANPYLGIEEWFEPGKEICVVASEEEAVDRYRYLLSHDSERAAMGAAARARILKQHTYGHRARQLMETIREYL